MSSPFLLFCLLTSFLILDKESSSFVVWLVVLFVFVFNGLLWFSERNSLWSALVSLLVLISSVFFLTNSLLMFFIAYESSLVPLSLLILLFGFQPENVNSSLYLVIYTLLCSLPLLIYTCVHLSSPISPLSVCGSVSVLLLSLSFVVKAPVYTLHLWLSKAHTEAPLSGSIILSGVILKFGSYGLSLLAPSLSPPCLLWVYLSLTGSLVCSIICFRSWDIKTLVAYSSVVHIGVVTLGLFSGLEVGYYSALGMIIGHSLISPLMFSVAYILYCSKSSRSFSEAFISSLNAFILLFLAVITAINSSLPPFLNFFVEVSLFAAMGSYFSCSLLILASSAFFSLVFCLFFFVRCVAGPYSAFFCAVDAPYALIPGIILSLLSSFSFSAFTF